MRVRNYEHGGDTQLVEELGADALKNGLHLPDENTGDPQLAQELLDDNVKKGAGKATYNDTAMITDRRSWFQEGVDTSACGSRLNGTEARPLAGHGGERGTEIIRTLGSGVRGAATPIV